ncbi:MAG: bifunctional hydroxymethylpyrimidine kinase/phosphomethylpyrimidine kinase, partial [Methanosarcinales archaeon]|nr:bifunctional hydroxymethylpyrimidine kinase/phosphomethylpyrimidine kinase [Methanosarcinales archaeon]
KTASALGVHATCVITSVTAQNTEGVNSVFDLPLAVIEAQFDAVLSDIEIGFAKCGMLNSPDIMRLVIAKLKEHDIPFVLDTVMAAEAGGSLMQDEAIDVLRTEMIPASYVITPNVHEASRITGTKIEHRADVHSALEKLAQIGARSAIITGGHFDATDYLYTNNEHSSIPGSFVEGGTHGAGCTYATAITSYLCKGYALEAACRHAKDFVTHAIAASVAIGHGAHPVNQSGHMIEMGERFMALSDVRKAVELLMSSDTAHVLIPEVRSNIGKGIPNAVLESDVAAVNGRMVDMRGRIQPVGNVDFGASGHVARIILVVMGYDATKRSGMNIRYSDKAVQVCEEMGLSCVSFRRQEEPENVNTMDWGVSSAIERLGYVPDMVYDLGDVGKEPMIRILGENAVDVAKMVVEIADRLDKEM